MSNPDWNVAIVDGQPEVVTNLAGVAALVRESPLGVCEALRRMRAMLPAAVYAELAGLVNGR